ELCVILHGEGTMETDHGSLSNEFGRDRAVYIAPRALYCAVGQAIREDVEGYTVHPPYTAADPSSWDNPYRQYAEFIESCISDAQIEFGMRFESKVRVVGHSMGAAAALVFAFAYPDQVSAVFAYAGHLASKYYARFPDPNAVG